MKSIHFYGGHENIELLMQRSTQAYQGSGETCSTSTLGKGGHPYRPFLRQKILPMGSNGETYGNNTIEISNILSEDQKNIQIVF